MRSMLHHLMDFDIKFLKSSDSLLKELKGKDKPRVAFSSRQVYI